MRIKRFHELVFDTKDKRELKKITSALKGIGMLVEFGESDKFSYIHAKIDVYDKRDIKWVDIKDCMLKLKKYLGDRFICLKYTPAEDIFDVTYKNIYLDEKTNIKGHIFDVVIRYDKK